MQSSPVTIAFDDGYLDTYRYALTYLDALGIRSTFAVPAGLIGGTCEKRPLVRWSHILKLNKSGHDIASHTLTHKNFLAKKKYSSKEISDEIVSSYTLLSERLDRTISSFVYPYIGRLPRDTVLNAVGKTYRSARISLETPVFNRLPITGRFALKGFCVHSAYTLNDLERCVEQAIREKSWLIEVFHLVGKKNTGSAHRDAPYRFFMHIDDFKQHIDFLMSTKIAIMTQKEVVNHYGPADHV